MSIVLKDGTELPALPDGWSEGTPYGAVVSIVWKDGDTGEILLTMYALAATERPFSALPNGMLPDGSGVSPGENSTHHLVTPLGRAKSYALDPETNTWGTVEEGEATTPVVSYGMNLVSWANHDLYEITELNEDMSYKVGSTVVRQSDENYRVTGGYMTSIANEARRLGGKTGGMLPEVMLDIYKGVAASATEVTSE